MSAIARRTREKTIAPAIAHSIRLLVDVHRQQQYRVVGITESILMRAENLLESHPLRAYDATQLATALVTNARLLAAGLTALTFVAADQLLLTVATAEGLLTDDPNRHP